MSLFDPGQFSVFKDIYIIRSSYHHFVKTLSRNFLQIIEIVYIYDIVTNIIILIVAQCDFKFLEWFHCLI